MLWVLLYIYFQPTHSLSTKCPEGTYIGRDHDQGCVKCPAGTYQPLRESTYCVECKRWTYSTGIVVSSPSDCKNCASGTYSINASACAPCPPFTISPQGAFRVTECRSKPGYYSEPGRNGLECPVNHFCPAGTSTPARCPSGKFSRPLSHECKPIWKHWGAYNWVLWGAWCSVCFLNVSWFTLNTSKHPPQLRGEIQIKIDP